MPNENFCVCKWEGKLAFSLLFLGVKDKNTLDKVGEMKSY